MRLTEPGVYVAPHGRVAVSITAAHGSQMYFIRDSDGYGSYVYSNNESDWHRIDIDAIKWPELPPKPTQCYVTYRGDGPYWRPFANGECVSSGIAAREYTVVPHPENDPEAVAMIEAAKEATNG